MKSFSALRRFATLLLLLGLAGLSVTAHSAIQAIIDADETRTAPVLHRTA